MKWWLIFIILIIAIVLFYYSEKRSGFASPIMGGGELFDDNLNLRSFFDSSVVGGYEHENINNMDDLNDYYKNVRETQEQLDPSVKNKTIIQLHSADWCKYCQLMKKPWIKLRKAAPKKKELENYVILQVDHDRDNAKGIKYIPTIVKHKPNGEIDIYSGKKNYKELYSWVIS